MNNFSEMPKYECYLESEFNWLGKIPKEWCVKRLKLLLKEVNIRSEAGEEQLLSLSKYTGVTAKNSLENHSRRAESLIGYKKVYIGDLVINKMQAVNGLLAVSQIEGITSPDYSIYRPANRKALDITYLCYLLNQPEYLGEFKRRVTGVMEGFIRLYTDDLYAIPAILPDFETQLAISSFLDKKPPN